MERISGYLSFLIAYDVDLDDSLFDGCQTVEDALQRINGLESGIEIEEIADSRSIRQVYYEGFEIEVKQ